MDFIEEIKAKQRNTLWPDVLASGRRVDEFLWSGSPSASIVQRIGASLFGLGFLGSGLLLLYHAWKEQSFILVLMSFGVLLLAAKITHSAFRSHKENKPK
jgi:hypothetical protein